MTTETATLPGIDVATRRFTVNEYRALFETGILPDYERTELINGHIVTPPPIGNPHQSTVDRLNRAFVRAIGDRAIVRVQGPLQLDDWNLPQPDVSLLVYRDDFYGSRSARTPDALLVVEVVDTSERYDRKLKLPLYARQGVAEVWLVLVKDGRIEAHADPSETGYERVRRASRGDRLSPEALPDLEFEVEELLGP